MRGHNFRGAGSGVEKRILGGDCQELELPGEAQAPSPIPVGVNR